MPYGHGFTVERTDIISCFKCDKWNCLDKRCVVPECIYKEHFDHNDVYVTAPVVMDESELNTEKDDDKMEESNKKEDSKIVAGGNPNEDYVRKIIAVGETLIKNAESIAGTEGNIRQIYIDVSLEREEGTPELNIHKSINIVSKVD